MTKGRICKNFWLRVINVLKTKDECFASLKNKFKSIIISKEIPNTHNIAIKNDFRVDLQYIIDILKDTYNEFPIENIAFSNIADAIKEISCADPQSLYNGIDSSQLR